MEGWISVKDRVPKIGQKVITWPAISDQVFEKYGFVTTSMGSQKPVKYWMPFPEPPKIKKQIKNEYYNLHDM